MAEGMVEIEVSVTAEDIAKGQRHDCSACPVARALNRWLRRGAHCDVCYSLGIFFETRKAQIAHIPDTPRAAKAFIGRFDNGEPVKPFSFMLTIPAKCLAVKYRKVTA